jgi:hypothetical protein
MKDQKAMTELRKLALAVLGAHAALGCSSAYLDSVTKYAGSASDGAASLEAVLDRLGLLCHERAVARYVKRRLLLRGRRQNERKLLEARRPARGLRRRNEDARGEWLHRASRRARALSASNSNARLVPMATPSTSLHRNV